LGYYGVVLWRIGLKGQCLEQAPIMGHRKKIDPLGLRDLGICCRDLAERYEMLVEVLER